MSGRDVYPVHDFALTSQPDKNMDERDAFLSNNEYF